MSSGSSEGTKYGSTTGRLALSGERSHLPLRRVETKTDGARLPVSGRASPRLSLGAPAGGERAGPRRVGLDDRHLALPVGGDYGGRRPMGPDARMQLRRATVAQMHFLNEGYGWQPCAKFRTPRQAEINVYERGEEIIVVTWIHGQLDDDVQQRQRVDLDACGATR